MCPIEVIPFVPVHVSESGDIDDLRSTPPSQEPREVRGIIYVLPEGSPPDHLVKADGFPESAGGMLESERLSPGHSKDESILTTPGDPELFDELGLQGEIIDNVLYLATNSDDTNNQINLALLTNILCQLLNHPSCNF